MDRIAELEAQVEALREEATNERAALLRMEAHRDDLQREVTRYAEALGETRYELAVAVGQRNEFEAKYLQAKADATNEKFAGTWRGPVGPFAPAEA